MPRFHRKTRRQFLMTTLTTAVGTVGSVLFPPLRRSGSKSSAAETPTSAVLEPTTIPQRRLGRTNIQLPILGLGTGRAPLATANREPEAIEQLQLALDLGICYFDTAASYGSSESFLGKVLPPYRDEIFLATKTAARDRDGAWRELERSLKRLNTDRLDLWQLHHVSFESELDTLFGPAGAIRAI